MFLKMFIQMIHKRGKYTKNCLDRWKDGRLPSGPFAYSKFQAHFTTNLFEYEGLKNINKFFFMLIPNILAVNSTKNLNRQKYHYRLPRVSQNLVTSLFFHPRPSLKHKLNIYFKTIFQNRSRVDSYY